MKKLALALTLLCAVTLSAVYYKSALTKAQNRTFDVSAEFRMDNSCSFSINGVSSAPLYNKKGEFDGSSNSASRHSGNAAWLYEEKVWIEEYCSSEVSSITDLLVNTTSTDRRFRDGLTNLHVSAAVSLFNNPPEEELTIPIDMFRNQKHSVHVYIGSLNLDLFNMQSYKFPGIFHSPFWCGGYAAYSRDGELTYFSATNREKTGIEYTVKYKAVLASGPCG